MTACENDRPSTIVRGVGIGSLASLRRNLWHVAALIKAGIGKPIGVTTPQCVRLIVASQGPRRHGHGSAVASQPEALAHKSLRSIHLMSGMTGKIQQKPSTR
jgi:hypothetical protein